MSAVRMICKVQIYLTTAADALRLRKEKAPQHFSKLLYAHVKNFRKKLNVFSAESDADVSCCCCQGHGQNFTWELCFACFSLLQTNKSRNALCFCRWVHNCKWFFKFNRECFKILVVLRQKISTVSILRVFSFQSMKKISPSYEWRLKAHLGGSLWLTKGRKSHARQIGKIAQFMWARWLIHQFLLFLYPVFALPFERDSDLCVVFLHSIYSYKIAPVKTNIAPVWDKVHSAYFFKNPLSFLYEKVKIHKTHKRFKKYRNFLEILRKCILSSDLSLVPHLFYDAQSPSHFLCK